MSARLVTLIAAVFCFASPPGAQSAEVEWLNSFTWNIDVPRHGGYSGLDLAADGRSFIIVSDRGLILRGVLDRTNGQISGVTLDHMDRLYDPDTIMVYPGRQDAEGIAIGPAGRIFVSFEGVNWVWAYDDVDVAPARIKSHPDFGQMQYNSALEALAVGPDGALYTLPERSGKMTRPFPVYRFRDGHWSKPFDIPRRGDYLPVGADIGPDGKFYLLERRFSGLLGFSTRIRRFDLNDDGLRGEETILTTGNRTHDNLEGIAVWHDERDEIRITMISDDNFSMFQRTELVEYRVIE